MPWYGESWQEALRILSLENVPARVDWTKKYWKNAFNLADLVAFFTVTGKQREYEENEKNSSYKSPRGSVEHIAGHNYRKVIVNGEITLKNHRKTAARVEVKQNFSGELIKSDNSPVLNYTDRGIYSVNPQGELKWTLDLPAGKEQKLTYQYSVLVRM